MNFLNLKTNNNQDIHEVFIHYWYQASLGFVESIFRRTLAFLLQNDQNIC